MSMTAERVRRMSSQQLLDELSFTTSGKNPEPYPEDYLNCVRWELQRRKKKQQKGK
jgi:hypothetical protein